MKSGANLPKNDPLVHAIGEIEELNATIGVALAYIWDNSDAMHLLMDVQNDLVVAINDLHHSGVKYDNRMKNERHRAIQEAAKRINLDLIEPKGEIIPGGTPASAHCHLARAVCRRAERSLLEINGGYSGNVAVYLDRLGELLFVLARLFVPADKLWEQDETSTEPVVAGTAEVPQQS